MTSASCSTGSTSRPSIRRRTRRSSSTSSRRATPTYGMVPKVVPPPVIDPPVPIERTPQQACTDWGYLHAMAKRFGYVTYLEPGPAPLANTLYWGPPVRPDLPQKPLNVNLGRITNVIGVSAAQDALATTLVETKVKDLPPAAKLRCWRRISARPPLGAGAGRDCSMRRSLRKRSMETSGLGTCRPSAGRRGCSTPPPTIRSRHRHARPRQVQRRAADRPAGRPARRRLHLRRHLSDAQRAHQIARGAYTQEFSLSRAELGARSPLVAQPGVS